VFLALSQIKRRNAEDFSISESQKAGQLVKKNLRSAEQLFDPQHDVHSQSRVY
jgi:hypothetical protein